MKTTKLLSLTALVATTMSFATVPALAAKNTWSSTTPTTVGGNIYAWSNGSNWSLNAVADTDAALFTSTSSGITILIDTDITVASVEIEQSSASLSSSNDATLTVTGEFRVTNSASPAIGEGVAIETGSLKVYDSASLTISGADVTVRGDDESTYAVNINYGSTVTVNSGSLTVKGTIYVGGTQSSLTVNGGTVTATTLDIYGAGSYATHITDGEVTVGTLTVESNSNIYVEGGKLVVGTLSQATNSGLNISGTGVVEITTSTAGADGAYIKVSGTGTLILDTAITGTVGESGNLTISFTESAQLVLNESLLAIIATSDDYCDLLQAETITFGGTNVRECDGDTLNGVIAPYVSADGYELDWQYDRDNYMLQVKATATPEPSMFGLMLGFGAIGLVATRRRRRAA